MPFVVPLQRHTIASKLVLARMELRCRGNDRRRSLLMTAPAPIASSQPACEGHIPDQKLTGILYRESQ
jgi:hypothetical protein